ncbi:MAG: bifunctional hydroxymethylpyrimidine kinase/phosphomethylpyrimidine kinase [Candidatus Methanoperedens sp.]|nr:bifunctional hydroxymethylpyrimidine kinase/phosphomethylpyrimidine kinase [Candidatus Methanoperedens sp.]
MQTILYDMPTALTIAGVDTGGGAGIAADLKTFAALGVHGTCVITSVTAQNTRGVLNSWDIPVEFIEEQFNAVVSDIGIDCAKTGMLSSPAIVRKVVYLLKDQRFPLVIDPVMAAEAGGKLLMEEAVSILIEELMPLCTVITPNLAEAQRLSGLKITDTKDARKAAKRIHDLGAKAVIVTGGHLKGTDVLYDGEYTYIAGELVKGGTHGSGCTHSAALAAELAKGTTLIEAAESAKKFVEKAILASVVIGGGVAPVNQVGHVLAEAERFHVLTNVEEAVELIQNNRDLSILIPEVGCNIAMGISGASSTNDVAAVSGRIVKLKGMTHAVGCVAFGASSHIARIVLTSMRADSSKRAAMNMRFSHEALAACRDIGLKVASFSREDEPEGVATMEWGVSEVISREGTVPEIIYDTGSVGKEAMIRIIGNDAVVVASKAIEIARAMIR